METKRKKHVGKREPIKSGRGRTRIRDEEYIKTENN